MRLIDADELIVFGIDDQENGGLFEFVPKDFIDDAPTIEAIPVEWIDQYIADETNGRKIELQHIRRMLEAWREEFEDDKCWENPRLA